MYLNEAMNANQTKVEDEIIFAGLHQPKLDKKKFQR